MASRVPRESSIVRSCLKALNDIPGAFFEKRWGSIYSRVGASDLNGCYMNRSVQIEVKVPGKKATPAQLQELERWNRAGAITGVAHSVDEAIEIATGWLRKR